MTSDVFLMASALDVIGPVVQSLTAIAAVALAYIALRIAAKPGIRVDVDRDGGPCIFTPGEEAVLSIHVDLRGYFDGKPTASDTKITVNVEQPWGFEAAVLERARRIGDRPIGEPWCRAREGAKVITVVAFLGQGADDETEQLPRC